MLKALQIRANFILVKIHLPIRLFLSLLLLFALGCKHQHKEVAAVEKRKVKKPAPVVKREGDKSKPAASNSIIGQKLGLTEKQIKGSRLYSFVNEWYGIPYKYGGCQKSGVDCSCFTNILYERVYGMELSRTAGDMFKECDKIAGEEAKEGDLCFFKMNDNKISHVGVYLKKDLFVHSSTSKGVMISSINEAYYKKSFFCAGRVKKS